MTENASKWTRTGGMPKPAGEEGNRISTYAIDVHGEDMLQSGISVEDYATAAE